MRALKIENGIVINVIKVADLESIPDGYVSDPDETGIGYTDNGDGTFSAPVNTDPISTKDIRDRALLALTYDFGDGRVMQTRPQDESNIRNAIEVMEAENLPSINWVMLDNIKYPVSVTDLKIALRAAQLAALQIWDDYIPSGD
jgi:hypothetical protein